MSELHHVQREADVNARPDINDHHDLGEWLDASQEHGDSENAVVHHMPWMAIAVTAHALLLLITAFIVFTKQTPEAEEVIQTAVAEEFVAPIPEPIVKDPVEFPNETEKVEEATEDPRLLEDAMDDHNEDPTDQEFEELSETNSDLDSAESPDPRKGTVSNVGLGGPPSGGGRQGGRGGQFFKRARGGPPGEVQIPEDPAKAPFYWLADHQAPDGHWDAVYFRDHSKRLRGGRNAAVTGNIDFVDQVGEDDAGDEAANVGLTGLAMLAFVGNGVTHREGEFMQVVRNALKWTMAQQDVEGCFGKREGDEFIYNHAICAMAIAEIYAISRDPKLNRPAQRAVDFIVEAQNPGLGWRYGVKAGDNDSSVTAWMVLALKSAGIAGLDYPEDQVYADANKWFDLVISEGDDGYLSTGYRGPGMGSARLASTDHYRRNASMDACAVMSRLFTGRRAPHDRDEIAPLVKRMQNDLPMWEDPSNPQHPEHRIDMYYWYYASLALYQVDGQAWDDWQNALFNPVLLKYQRGWHAKDVERFGPRVATKEGRFMLDEHGSWDPVGAWGSIGGRVYSTAINALTLGVFYRYGRITDEGLNGDKI